MFQNLKLQGFSSNPLILRTLCSKGIAIEPVWTRSRQKNSNTQIGCWILLWIRCFPGQFSALLYEYCFLGYSRTPHYEWLHARIGYLSLFSSDFVEPIWFLLMTLYAYDAKTKSPWMSLLPNPNVQTQLRTLVITTVFIPRPKSHSHDDLGLFTALRSSGSRRHRPADQVERSRR